MRICVRISHLKIFLKIIEKKFGGLNILPYLCCVERQTAASPIEALKPTAVKVKPLLNMRNLSEIFSRFEGIKTTGMNRLGGLSTKEWLQGWSQTFECIVAVQSATTFEEAVAYLRTQIQAHGVQGHFRFDNKTTTEPVWFASERQWETRPAPNPNEPTWVHVQRGRVF